MIDIVPFGRGQKMFFLLMHRFFAPSFWPKKEAKTAGCPRILSF